MSAQTSGTASFWPMTICATLTGSSCYSRPLPYLGTLAWCGRRLTKPLILFTSKNHKRSECHVKYNPEDVKKMYPDANLMTCEQVFCWMGRYKKILNSTPKTHFHFLLHRLIIGRNRYTEYCYRENRYPLLPSVKMPKSLSTS